MHKVTKWLVLASVVGVMAIPSAAHAITISWAETGDAGDLPGTAQKPLGPLASLTSITGAIGSTTDADMYQLHVTGLFSATTVGTPGTLGDTQLFLFDVFGRGVEGNDNTAANARSTLPITFGPPPGTYYLVIAGYNVDPVSVGGLIFADTPRGNLDTASGPGAGSPISGYTGTSSTGTYTIALTGVQVPEPDIVLLLGAALALTAGVRRLRQS
jgi:hypothetical protein